MQTTTTATSTASSAASSLHLRKKAAAGEQSSVAAALLASLREGIPFTAPPCDERDSSVPHAPTRTPNLTPKEKKLALQNALRYIPKEYQEELAKEFAEELERYGHIYMYRFRPTHYAMKAYPIDAYPAKCRPAAAIMLMIQNNLDPRVAMYPHELITYGGNGAVFQNWAQYNLVMKYLSEMSDEQTLVMYSGHPMGLFPSSKNSPRVVITNGMVIPNYSSKEEYERMSALGVSMYGQMTAGSYCYIGPQGIVHGTTITLLNASRKYLGTSDMKGKVFVTAGLGGMSGAQAKAAVICGAIGVVAEVDESAIDKRHSQGWVMEKISDLESCLARIKQAREEKKPLSIAFHGNVVDLWERLAAEEELLVDLGSDQTSLHNPYGGGYYPVGFSFEQAQQLMKEDPSAFKQAVQESLRRQVNAINHLTSKGLKFWDYGNSFLLEASRAGADVANNDENTSTAFRYPSYVEDIMGDIFSLGFGPFRWVCASGDPTDLQTTDDIAAEVVATLSQNASERSKQQYEDNHHWIVRAAEHKLVVGSQARILYSDAEGRMAIAEAFNQAVKDGKLSGPVVISRDHHDVSGTDSPYRETANITDGSKYCADMAVQNFVGDAMRGATWVALHNGGGCGWGEVINGGFGLVLDGSEEASQRARNMLFWDVNNGVSRRAWGMNENAEHAVRRAMQLNPSLRVTLPHHADPSVIAGALSAASSAQQ
ncbi:Urocanate hydratase [Balamuthia mandrillaris]